jgi:hypothetical protein
MRGYFRLYCWLRHCFPENKFTSKQFRELFSTAQYSKVLHDLSKIGYIERNKRGEYRIKSPKEIEENTIKKDLENMHLLEKTQERPYAFCGPNAIRIWSNGKHHPGITDGLKPINIKILEKDLPWWQKFLEEHAAAHHIGGRGKTLFGVVYILHPAHKINAVTKHGMPVVPLPEALASLDPESHQTREIKRELSKK